MTPETVDDQEAEFLSILDQLPPDHLRKLASTCSTEAGGRLSEMAEPLRAYADTKDLKQKLDEAA